jgi:hypothetical protein
MADIRDVMQSAFARKNKRTKSNRMTFDGHRARIGASDVAACARKTAYGILFGEPDPTLEQIIESLKV